MSRLGDEKWEKIPVLGREHVRKYVHSEVVAGCITVSGCNLSGRGCDAAEMQGAVGRIEGRAE